MRKQDAPKEPRFHGKVSEQRHRNMSRIRGKDTSIEIKLRKALWNKGIRYRKNYKDLPGSPDIALTKYKIAIFCVVSFFMVKIGKFYGQDLKKVIILIIGLKR